MLTPRYYGGGPRDVADGPATVSWAPADRPTTWTRIHVTEDGIRTRCGVRIPPESAIYDWDRGDEPCARCGS